MAVDSDSRTTGQKPRLPPGFQQRFLSHSYQYGGSVLKILIFGPWQASWQADRLHLGECSVSLGRYEDKMSQAMLKKHVSPARAA